MAASTSMRFILLCLVAPLIIVKAVSIVKRNQLRNHLLRGGLTPSTLVKYSQVPNCGGCSGYLSDSDLKTYIQATKRQFPKKEWLETCRKAFDGKWDVHKNKRIWQLDLHRKNKEICYTFCTSEKYSTPMPQFDGRYEDASIQDLVTGTRKRFCSIAYNGYTDAEKVWGGKYSAAVRAKKGFEILKNAGKARKAGGLSPQVRSAPAPKPRRPSPAPAQKRAVRTVRYGPQYYYPTIVVTGRQRSKISRGGRWTVKITRWRNRHIFHNVMREYGHVKKIEEKFGDEWTYWCNYNDRELIGVKSKEKRDSPYVIHCQEPEW